MKTLIFAAATLVVAMLTSAPARPMTGSSGWHTSWTRRIRNSLRNTLRCTTIPISPPKKSWPSHASDWRPDAISQGDACY